jgi:3-ketoacyl-CoA synthase
MGCSAGVIALGLAQDLLQAHPGSLALVISHENICNATYTGRRSGYAVTMHHI